MCATNAYAVIKALGCIIDRNRIEKCKFVGRYKDFKLFARVCT